MTGYLKEIKKEEIEKGSREIMKKMRMFEGLSKKDVSALIRDFSTSNPDTIINKIFFVKVLRDPRLVRACVFMRPRRKGRRIKNAYNKAF